VTPEALRDAWQARWGEALAAWSKVVRLQPPRWCMTPADEAREGLRDSFAQIRLGDHAVVLSARQLVEHDLAAFPREIMGHEIGHHVYCPGDLADDGRMIARMRRALPGKERMAPLVGNLYGDLLINDRLQRSAGLDMAGVWRVLARRGAGDRLWTLYMSIYEHLWSLPRGELSRARTDARTDVDAQLGARVVRAYAKDWVRGAGRFAALLFPYLEEAGAAGALGPSMDLLGEQGGEIPHGLAAVDDDEDDVVHPVFDPELSGVGDPPDGTGRARLGGRKSAGRYRELGEYGELLKAIGVAADARDVAVRYYRERALPHLVRFPARRAPRAAEPQPEGLETWDAGSPLERVDWIETVVRSPFVIPGVTTVERTYGAAPGHEPKRAPVDLYVGIDCSGSMPNPRLQTSYPALAGAIVSLSALRAGARVKVVLSGEPGQTYAMPDFRRDEGEVLDVLTSYLGTGVGFGVHRLADTFDGRTPRDRPVHVLLLSDQDLFRLLEKDDGWDVARRALASARGGGTVALDLPEGSMQEPVARLRKDGWGVHYVPSWQALVDFAREFSRRAYEQEEGEKR
jgi:hypothetical protein